MPPASVVVVVMVVLVVLVVLMLILVLMWLKTFCQANKTFFLPSPVIIGKANSEMESVFHIRYVSLDFDPIDKLKKIELEVKIENVVEIRW